VAPRRSAGITAARTTFTARKAIAIAVVTAHSARAHTHVATARGVDAADEVIALLIRALHAELILAHSVLSDGVLISVNIRAALASSTCAGVPTAGAELVTLKVDSMSVLTTRCPRRSAKSSTARVIGRTKKLVRVVGARLEDAFGD